MVRRSQVTSFEDKVEKGDHGTCKGVRVLKDGIFVLALNQKTGSTINQTPQVFQGQTTKLFPAPFQPPPPTAETEKDKKGESDEQVEELILQEIVSAQAIVIEAEETQVGFNHTIVYGH